MRDQEIIQLSDRDHILLRPSMYLGSVDPVETEDFFLEEGKFQKKKVQYVPGLLKIINEVIDNSVDEAVRTGFEYANRIRIDLDTGKGSIQIQDNGRGIPIREAEGSDHLMPILAFCNARSGSNFEDESRETIGMNGVGAAITNIYSKQFTVDTADGNRKLLLHSRDNMRDFEYQVYDKNKNYTQISFTPDFERFGVDGLDEVHTGILYQRLLLLSLTYPRIEFWFNGRKVRFKSDSEFMSCFADDFEFIKQDNFIVGVFPSPDDDFNHFSVVNGLYTSGGGNHVNLIQTEVVNRLRERIRKKYPEVKPGDIRNKLSVVAFFRGFSGMKFDSQTKETLTNSNSEIREFLGLEPEDWDRFCTRIYKNVGLLEPIVEFYKIKQEHQRRKELSKMSSNRNRTVTSDKFIAPIGGENKYLMLTEGDSATGGLSAILGRRGIGYFSLRGKPINSYEVRVQKLVANAEIKSIVEILGLDLTDPNTDCNFENIVFLSDQDSDGIHIRSLLLTFFWRFAPRLFEEGRILFMQTPLVVAYDKKSGEPKHWFFSFEEYHKFLKKKSGKDFRWQYYKGLGSWKKNDLNPILQKIGGFERLMVKYQKDVESGKYLDYWMGSGNSSVRREMMEGLAFNISTL